MMKRIRWLAVASALIYALEAPAQTFEPSTLNASGGSAEIAGNLYEYSIGEMTLVHTTESPNLIVTQGLLQPKEPTSSITEATLLEKQLAVYPNPTNDILYIQPNIEYGGKLVFALTDITGRNLMYKKVVLTSGTEKQRIDLAKFAAGSYLLHVIFTHKNQDFVRNFKVQKLK